MAGICQLNSTQLWHRKAALPASAPTAISRLCSIVDP